MSTNEQTLPTGSSAAPNSWWAAWQTSPALQMEREFIRLLGSAWEFRRQQVLDRFARHYYGLETGTYAGLLLNAMVDRLIDQWQFISQIQVAPVQPGAPPPFLLHLSVRGEAAFESLELRRRLTPFTWLQTRYISAQRVYLALETRDVLARAGYQVDLAPAAIPLAAGPKFKPDLIARRATSQMCVQIEREAKFWAEAARATKWRRVMSATDGQIYIVTDTAEAMQHLLAELRARRFDRSGVLHLTNLQQVDQFFAERHTLWLVEESLQ